MAGVVGLIGCPKIALQTSFDNNNNNHNNNIILKIYMYSYFV